jgi:hypothetical protein
MVCCPRVTTIALRVSANRTCARFCVILCVTPNAPVDVYATFHDNAATAEAEVPDESLLGLSLTGLPFLRRKLC